MLEFVLIGFLVLVIFVVILAVTAEKKGKVDSSAKDAVLSVTGENRSDAKISSGSFEYDRDALKKLAGTIDPAMQYVGPRVHTIMADAKIDYRTLLFYTAGSKKVQKMLQKDEAGKDAWIVAIASKDKDLTWSDGGPFMLVNRTDATQNVARLLKIEAK